MGQVVQVTLTGGDSFYVYGLTADPVADFVSYWNGQLGATAAAVAAATADNRKRALNMAAGWQDRAVAFSGTKTSASQPREFPRDGVTCDGEDLGDNVTPNNVAKAEFELAGLLLVNATTATGTGTGSNVQSVGAGPANVSFFAPTIGTAFDTRLPIQANDLLKCMFASNGTDFGPYVNGDDVESDFDEDDFERCQSYT
jgi:hypothetical protein